MSVGRRPVSFLRYVLLALMAVLSMTALAACAGDGEADDPEAAESDRNDGDEGSASQTSGGTLIQVIAADPPTLNPAITTGTPDLYVACKVFEGLVRLDSDYDVVPGLAEDWDIEDDGHRYVFHLREGVTWHDGEPFTSSDVAWTFENVTREYGPRSAEAFERVDSIETPDDHTVVLEMTEPYGALLSLMTCANSAILPEHIYGDGEDILEHPRNTNDPIGTGPFQFGSWDHGEAVTLEAYDGYWRSDEGMPFLDRLILQPFEDPQGATLALEAGEVDVVTDYSLDMAAYQRLHERPELHGEQDTNLPTNNLLILNTSQPPFDDVVVRRAVFHAINRDLIIDNVHFGLGNAGRSAIDSRLGWAHNDDIDYNEMYAYDPDRAAELLDEAGYEEDSNGTRLEITIPFETGNPDFQGTSEIIAENLREIGVVVNLEPSERSVMLETVFDRHDFDATIQRYTTFGEVAIGVQRLYLCSAVDGGNFTNASRYCNEEVDELFARGAAAPTPEERAPYYHELQEILAEDVPTLVLTENPSADLVNANVKGMWKGPDPYDWWEEVYFEE